MIKAMYLTFFDGLRDSLDLMEKSGIEEPMKCLSTPVDIR